MQKTLVLTALILALLGNIGTKSAQAKSFERQAKTAIRHVFPPHAQPEAIAVSHCETGGFVDQYNERSGAKGIFQVIPGNDERKLFDWKGRFVLRIEYDRLYNMFYSATVAYWMSRGGRDWDEWDCG